MCTYVNHMCCLVHLKKFYGFYVLIKKEKVFLISVPMGIYSQVALVSDAGVMPYSSEESPFCFPHCLYQYTSPHGQCTGSCSPLCPYQSSSGVCLIAATVTGMS